ncbi:efflux RND transporter periplasmic adaptor subunit [Zhongshania sp.]|jgi:Cu(I)/Ag(I) efflux system membrane fusion protein|uniref:efflux RND transporter periplasmic adaptor subunit n=1 Tax=Zhongshania sp. TaxID=1971902 RepID=UPI002A80C1AC|nr:efflux RND transporter periplasmic adaptor subunit [Zhongshania sp.]
MSSSKNILIISVCSGLLLGALLGVYIIAPQTTPPITGSTESHAPPEPLYWVAPMDPDFRRPGPGKSPMGMDLLPVYADSSANNSSPGTVSISADIVNNLGVRTAQARYGKFTQTIRAPATIQFNEDQLQRVQPRVEGWVQKLYAHAEGDAVTAGTPLYTLYSPALVTAQEEFLLALKRNNHELIMGAEQRLLSLEIDPSIIQKIKETRTALRSITILAPRTGVLSELNIREGDYVMPGKAIATIATLDSMWAIADIIGGQGSSVTIGDHASVSIDGIPNRTWSATVDYIYPTLDEINRSQRLRLKLDNNERILKPNMFAHVNLTQKAKTNSVIIPKEAVIRSESQDRVILALGSGRFKAIAVSAGQFNNREAEIIHGIEADDEVVVSAQFLLDSESSKDSDFIRMNHSSAPSTKVAP